MAKGQGNKQAAKKGGAPSRDFIYSNNPAPKDSWVRSIGGASLNESDILVDVTKPKIKPDPEDKNWVDRADPKYNAEFKDSAVGDFGFKGRC